MPVKKEPVWLRLIEIVAIHEKLLVLHGGSAGIRDRGLLESALDRPKNLWVYEKRESHVLATAYADGIVNNHPFVDGNKRTGFVSAILFLESNGLEFFGSEAEAALMTNGLADKNISTDQYAEWLKENCRRS